MVTMFSLIVVVALGMLRFAMIKDISTGPDVSIISRAEWGARPALEIESLAHPAPIVIIHHSHMVPCKESCTVSVVKIQDFHMDVRGWSDIGYNFLVGGQGQIFEGRGWSVKGAHAGPAYNFRSIGICLIGNFSEFLPEKEQLARTKTLIEYGVRRGYIHPEYELRGHREVRNTTCPGDALFEEIQKWPQKVSPSSH